MSILYNELQEAIGTESRRVLDARTSKDRLLELLEQTGEWDKPFWDTAVEQGWTALTVGEQHGGMGLGLIELGLVAQAAGAATAGAPFLTTGYGVSRALQAAGAEADGTRDNWLSALASGEAKGCVAFAEGTAPLPPSPAATFFAGKLSGTKDGVSGGLAADVALVWASSDGQPALVLVELSDAQRAAIFSYDNSRCYADLSFDNAPATLLALGVEAHALALDVLARMAVVTAHEQTGGAEELMNIGREYALTRKAFGQPIAAFQSVKHRLAELYALVEIARANCIHAASREDKADFLTAAAAARLSATEAYDGAARDTIQIHGGIGASWETGLHLHMRRARSLASEQGNTLFWEDLLAEQLTRLPA